MKQTSVEWFLENLRNLIKESELTDMRPSEFDAREMELLVQAKDLEMKHLAQAFDDGEHNYFYSKKTGEDFENGIEYYNEKFKQQEQ